MFFSIMHSVFSPKLIMSTKEESSNSYEFHNMLHQESNPLQPWLLAAHELRALYCQILLSDDDCVLIFCRSLMHQRFIQIIFM